MISSETEAVLPLESVTVTLMVNVPLFDNAEVVKDFEVYVFPSTVVLYDEIVAPSLPDAVMTIFRFETVCIYPPYVE